MSINHIIAYDRSYQSSDQREGDALVWEGIFAFYNYEFEKSVQVLSRAKNQYPDHPVVHFTWAVSKWLRAQGYDGIEESYTVLEQALTEIIPIYEDLIHRFPDEPLYPLYLSSSKGLKARIHLGKKEWLSVVVEGLKGYRGVTAVHKQNPELWDAYFPIAMLNFYVGNSSSVVRFFARILGIPADREVGLSQIRIAAEKGEFSWIEANLALMFIYLWIDDDYESSLPLALKLRDLFPTSIYNQHLYTESLIRTNRLDQAEKNLDLTFNMVKSLPPMSKKGWIPTLKYQKALLEFYRGEYDSSLKWVTESIEEFQTELDTPLGFGYLLRGNIYDLRGERNQAIVDYQAAINLANYTSTMKHARAYFKEPFIIP